MNPGCDATAPTQLPQCLVRMEGRERVAGKQVSETPATVHIRRQPPTSYQARMSSAMFGPATAHLHDGHLPRGVTHDLSFQTPAAEDWVAKVSWHTKPGLSARDPHTLENSGEGPLNGNVGIVGRSMGPKQNLTPGLSHPGLLAHRTRMSAL